MADYNSSYTGQQIDNAVGAGLAVRGVSGIVKSDGSGNISAAVPGTDYQAPGGGGDMSALYFDDYDTALWTIGTLTSANGTDYTSTNRIRTEILSKGVKKVTPKSGYKMLLYIYDASGTYLGVWTGSDVEKATTNNWFTTAVDFADLPTGSQVRLVVGDTSDSTITTSTQDTVAQNIILTRYTDDSLSHSGYPADAAATGAMFDKTLLTRSTLTSSDNLNSIIEPGIYFAGRYSGAGGYPTNAPTGFSGDRMRVVSVRAIGSISGAWQMTVDGAGTFWSRGYNGTQNSGAWSAWQKSPTSDEVSDMINDAIVGAIEESY